MTIPSDDLRPRAVLGGAGVEKFYTRLALTVSNVFSPPLMGIAGLLITIPFIGRGAAQTWLPSIAVLSILLPAAYILWLIKRGEVTDLYLRERHQRIKPLGVSLFCSLLVWWLVVWLDAPLLLRAIAVVQVIQGSAILAITLRWKISAHSITGAAVVGLAFFLWGTEVWSLLFLIPLIAWSRVWLNRHTLSQTIAGTLLGLFSLSIGLLIYF